MRDPAGNRVLMLLENQPYPTDVRVRREALALTEAGYRVTVICPGQPGQPRLEEIDGVRVVRYRLPLLGTGTLGFIWEFAYATLATLLLAARVASRFGVDVVHAHNPPDTFFVVGLCFKLLGKRFVFDHHDLAPEMYRARGGGHGSRLIAGGLQVLEGCSCRLADEVIATNESYRTVAIGRHGLPAEKVTVVRNGPELGRLQEVPPDPELRARAETILGYVGVMGPQDGVDYLLRALKSLIVDLGRDDVLCLLIGPGDCVPALRRLAIELGVERHVLFTGPVQDPAALATLLSSADICIDPDPANGYNDRSTMLKMLDYMAVARPIVAFDLTEHHYSAGDAAVYVAGNDVEELARQIAALIDDPARRRAMGRIGRARIETRLAWQYSVPQLLTVYERLLPGRAQAAARA